MVFVLIQSIYKFHIICHPLAATSSGKKPISVSQHSSISQADDCSSPYARVRSPSHAYDKVRPAEHPYAQVKAVSDNNNRPSTSATAAANNNQNAANNNPNEPESLSQRSSRESLLDAIDGRPHQVRTQYQTFQTNCSIQTINRFAAGNSSSFGNRRQSVS